MSNRVTRSRNREVSSRTSETATASDATTSTSPRLIVTSGQIEHVFAPVSTLVERNLFSDETDQRLVSKVDSAFGMSVTIADPVESYKYTVAKIKEAIINSLGDVGGEGSLIVDLKALRGDEMFDFLRVQKSSDDGPRYLMKGSMIQREPPVYSKDGSCAFAIYGRADTHLIQAESMLNPYGQQIAHVDVYFPLSNDLEWKAVGISTTTNELQYQTYITYIIEATRGILHYFILCFDRYRSIEVVVQLSCKIPQDVIEASKSGAGFPEYIKQVTLQAPDVTDEGSDDEGMDVEDPHTSISGRREKLRTEAFEKHRKVSSASSSSASSSSDWLTQMLEENVSQARADKELAERLRQIDEETESGVEGGSSTDFTSTEARPSHSNKGRRQRHEPIRRVITTNPATFHEMNANIFTKLGRRLKNLVGTATGMLSTKGVLVDVNTTREAAAVNNVTDSTVIDRLEDAAQKFRAGTFPKALPINIKYVTIKSSSSLKSKYDRKNKAAWLASVPDKGYKILKLPLDQPLVFENAGKSTIDIHIEEVQGKAFRDLDSQFLLSPEVVRELLVAEQGKQQPQEEQQPQERQQEEKGGNEEGEGVADAGAEEKSPEQQREALLEAAAAFTSKDLFKGIAFLGTTRAVLVAVKLTGATSANITDIWIVDASPEAK